MYIIYYHCNLLDCLKVSHRHHDILEYASPTVKGILLQKLSTTFVQENYLYSLIDTYLEECILGTQGWFYIRKMIELHVNLKSRQSHLQQMMKMHLTKFSSHF